MKNLKKGQDNIEVGHNPLPLHSVNKKNNQLIINRLNLKCQDLN